MTAQQVIEQAYRELGYIGKKSAAELDDKLTNVVGKYTKYARDLYDAGFYNGNKNGYDWCCVFVDWLFYIIGGSKDAVAAVKPLYDLGAGVYWARKAYADNKRLSDKPIAGAQIFFKDNAGRSTHTGFVVSVSGDRIRTIEGNISNSVVEREYSINDSRINGFGIPLYDDPEPVDELKAKLTAIRIALTKIVEEIGDITESL